MITSETFYRAECDHEGCGRTLDDHERDITHWPRKVLEELLAEPTGADDATWTVVGGQVFCPRHKPASEGVHAELRDSQVAAAWAEFKRPEHGSDYEALRAAVAAAFSAHENGSAEQWGNPNV